MMGNIRIFIDFGSTFTKAVAFDLDREELVARAQAPSSVDTDVNVGLSRAIESVRGTIPVSEDDVRRAVACSSAAGGLRMVCIGLVPEYTTEAGRLAALGAGAKIAGAYSYELSQGEAEEIAKTRPDIILLTGGTDGGNKKIIAHNARMLAAYAGGVPNIIVAGNKSAADEVRAIFKDAGREVFFTNNVMPEFGRLDIDPVNDKIRDIFIRHITQAKGISRARERICDVIMPTPAAVLEAAKLIADGVPGLHAGLGELLLIDVGGATTDVYSIAKGTPTKDGVNMIGLPEPYAKRSVEGDLGMYHNLDTLLEIALREIPAEMRGASELARRARKLRQTLCIPSCDEQERDRLTLSRLAVRTAADRHAGRLDVRNTHNGQIWFQKGKDLTDVKYVIGSGGPLAFSADPRYVLEGAALEGEASAILKPRAPRYFLDQKYILFAIGLLSRSEPVKAFRMANKYLKQL